MEPYVGGSTLKAGGTFVEFAARLDSIQKNLEDMRSRVTQTADRALGSQPESASGGAPRPEPSSQADRVRERIDGVERLCQALRQQIERFDAL